MQIATVVNCFHMQRLLVDITFSTSCQTRFFSRSSLTCSSLIWVAWRKYANGSTPFPTITNYGKDIIFTPAVNLSRFVCLIYLGRSHSTSYHTKMTSCCLTLWYTWLPVDTLDTLFWFPLVIDEISLCCGGSFVSTDCCIWNIFCECKTVNLWRFRQPP